MPFTLMNNPSRISSKTFNAEVWSKYSKASSPCSNGNVLVIKW